jgi:hypothetical protein
MMASFQRPGARSKVRGLYLAGGTVHPGARGTHGNAVGAAGGLGGG